MFLADPPRTPYDLRFEILGFPLRVTPFFWLVAALLGYNLSVSLHTVMDSSPGQFVLLVMWIVAVFLSILIHELGHALAMRYYGQHASVVLYHFGGLAIAEAGGSFRRQGLYRRPTDQIIISLAGPGAQLLLALVIVLGVRLAGYQSLIYAIWPVDQLIAPRDGSPLPSATLDIMVYFLVMPSIWWALLNLLPIFPLDGGQVSRALFTMYNGSTGIRDSLILSIAAAAGVAVYLYSLGEVFNSLLFISLGVSSYQLLQTMRYHGGHW